jgi:hypothetical protein
VTFGANGLPASGPPVNVAIFPDSLPTTRVHHYSLDLQYDLGHNWIAMLGYEGSLSRNIYFLENPNAAPAALGYPLNPRSVAATTTVCRAAWQAKGPNPQSARAQIPFPLFTRAGSCPDWASQIAKLKERIQLESSAR